MPKLGCFRCGYDCYELEGDRCPECNTLIDRGAPWWRDGRWTLWVAWGVAACAGIAGAANRLLIATSALSGMWLLLAAMATVISFFALLLIAIGLSCKRTRVPRHQPIRGVPVAVIARAPFLLAQALGY